jgi:predicted metal-dependent TIM-barrel fold hydrolase
VVAVSEPAFWAGSTSSAAASPTTFRHLTDVEPKRAARTASTTTAGCASTPRRRRNVELSREVIKLIPPTADHPRVLGVGEIGLNKNTRNEITIFEEQVDLAAKHDQLILIHTPHLEDKHKGTRSSRTS